MSYGSTLASYRQEFGNIKIQILSSFFRFKKSQARHKKSRILISAKKSQVGNPAAAIT